MVRLGVFFAEVVGGCNCHDDPVATHSYALLGLRIARSDGAAVWASLGAVLLRWHPAQYPPTGESRSVEAVLAVRPGLEGPP